MSSAKGLTLARKLANDPDAGRTLLWCSIPCTGGGALNWMNPVRDTPKFKRKGREDRKLMKQLWSSIETVAHRVLADGGRITIEWPANWAYVAQQARGHVF